MNNSGNSNSGNNNSGNNTTRMAGGRRRRGAKGRATRKMSGGKRKLSPWNILVKKVFQEMKRKNKDASFGDALKAASKRKREM